VWDELLFNDTTTQEARLSFRPATPEGATLYVQVLKTPVRDAQNAIVGTQAITVQRSPSISRASGSAWR